MMHTRIFLQLKYWGYRLLFCIYPKEVFSVKIEKYRTKLRSYIRCSFKAHFEENRDYSRYPFEIKAVAYYLPQFHANAENDIWWGKGFTECTRTEVAVPRHRGHYQPRVPHRDIGCYDLSDVRVMGKQAALAKQHGIFGFCMYYYWFSGKRLLQKPLDNLMAHPEIDFPFCLCWANESWARTWDNASREVLIEQSYRPEDPLLFIRDLAPYLKDKRYIRRNGKPIVLVYNIPNLPDPARLFSVWRQYCRQHGIGEIEIWGVRAFIGVSHSFGTLVDREVEFPPYAVCGAAAMQRRQGEYRDEFFDYKQIVEEIVHPCLPEQIPSYPIVRAAMLGWDDTAHKKRVALLLPKIFLCELITAGYVIWRIIHAAIFQKETVFYLLTPGTNGEKVLIWNRMKSMVTAI